MMSCVKWTVTLTKVSTCFRGLSEVFLDVVLADIRVLDPDLLWCADQFIVLGPLLICSELEPSCVQTTPRISIKPRGMLVSS